MASADWERFAEWQKNVSEFLQSNGSSARYSWTWGNQLQWQKPIFFWACINKTLDILPLTGLEQRRAEENKLIWMSTALSSVCSARREKNKFSVDEGDENHDFPLTKKILMCWETDSLMRKSRAKWQRRWASNQYSILLMFCRIRSIVRVTR